MGCRSGEDIGLQVIKRHGWWAVLGDPWLVLDLQMRSALKLYWSHPSKPAQKTMSATPPHSQPTKVARTAKPCKREPRTLLVCGTREAGPTLVWFIAPCTLESLPSRGTKTRRQSFAQQNWRKQFMHLLLAQHMWNFFMHLQSN